MEKSWQTAGYPANSFRGGDRLEDVEQLLPLLKGELRELLDEELALGNTLHAVEGNWPMPIVNIWLDRPISDKYKARYPRLRYSYLGDPHQWLEEYIDLENGGMVAARYIVQGSARPL